MKKVLHEIGKQTSIIDIELLISVFMGALEKEGSWKQKRDWEIAYKTDYCSLVK